MCHAAVSLWHLSAMLPLFGYIPSYSMLTHLEILILVMAVHSTEIEEDFVSILCRHMQSYMSDPVAMADGQAWRMTSRHAGLAGYVDICISDTANINIVTSTSPQLSVHLCPRVRGS